MCLKAADLIRRDGASVTVVEVVNAAEKQKTTWDEIKRGFIKTDYVKDSRKAIITYLQELNPNLFESSSAFLFSIWHSCYFRGGRISDISVQCGSVLVLGGSSSHAPALRNAASVS